MFLKCSDSVPTGFGPWISDPTFVSMAIFCFRAMHVRNIDRMRAGIRFYNLSSYGLDKILKDLTEVNILKSRHDTKRASQFALIYSRLILK